MTRTVTRVVVGLLLAATALYVWRNPPENLAMGRDVLTAVPAVFGDWNGTELSFEDAVVDELQADDILIRRYERDGHRVWLCVIYHQNRRYGAHDPRLCYESQGYLVEPETLARVDDGSPEGLRVNRFVADQPRQRRLVYYWWSSAGVATSDRDEMRRRMMVSGALENRSWGAFVRVETPMAVGEEQAAEVRLQDFAARVARDLPAVFARVDSSASGPS